MLANISIVLFYSIFVFVA